MRVRLAVDSPSELHLQAARPRPDQIALYLTANDKMVKAEEKNMTLLLHPLVEMYHRWSRPPTDGLPRIQQSIKIHIQAAGGKDSLDFSVYTNSHTDYQIHAPATNG